MLRYLGLGQRHFGDRPMPAHKRVNWEFFAVIRGKVAPFFSAAPEVTPVADTFWLFPPGHHHGWVGQPGKESEVIVIHFNTVPKVIADFVAERGPPALALSGGDKSFLRAIAKTLRLHYWHPIRESEIHTERAILDLCLLILRDFDERSQPVQTSKSLGKIISAENWRRDHLADNPAIADVAQAVGLSASQLNRLFHQVRKRSPQQVLDRLKIDRAMEILGSSNSKLLSVALACGFTTASNLCRAFRRLNGHTPTVWRREIYIQYHKPGKERKEHHHAHGRRLRLP